MWLAVNWGPNGQTFTNTAPGITINGLPGSSSAQTTTNSIYHVSSSLMGVAADTQTTNSGLVAAISYFANSYPGPWHIQDHFPASPWVAGHTYSGSLVLTAANGATVPLNGLPTPVTGLVDASVAEQHGGVTSSGVVPFTFTPTATGTFSGTFSSSDVAAAHATAYVSTHGRPTGVSGYQMVVPPVATSTATPFSGTAAAPTQPGTLTIHKVDSVPDSAGGQLPLAGAVFRVTGPNGYAVTTTVPRTGNRTLTKLPYGTYTITETSPPPGWQLTSTPQTVTVGSTGSAPPASPTVTFADSPTPAKLITDTSAIFLHSGTSVSDKIVVATIPTNPGINSTAPDQATVGWILVGPVAMDPTGACAASDYAHGPNAGSGSVHIVGDGTYSTPAVIVHDAGCYGWIDGIPASPYTQGAISFPNSPTPSSELSYLIPTITTVAHQSGPAVGSTLTDTVTVGAITGEPSSVAWTVYGPVPPTSAGACPATASAWSGASK
ncbi:MAG: SpaA isopeptide-forming pilin-related protein, partial [Acidimicrobiales bacterium]